MSERWQIPKQNLAALRRDDFAFLCADGTIEVQRNVEILTGSDQRGSGRRPGSRHIEKERCPPIDEMPREKEGPVGGVHGLRRGAEETCGGDRPLGVGQPVFGCPGGATFNPPTVPRCAECDMVFSFESHCETCAEIVPQFARLLVA